MGILDEVDALVFGTAAQKAKRIADEAAVIQAQAAKELAAAALADAKAKRIAAEKGQR